MQLDPQLSAGEAWQIADFHLVPSSRKWLAFRALLADEAKASHAIQELLQTNRLLRRKKYHILHRPLVLK